MSLPLARNRWAVRYGKDRGAAKRIWMELGHPIELFSKVGWKSGGWLYHSIMRHMPDECRRYTEEG